MCGCGRVCEGRENGDKECVRERVRGGRVRLRKGQQGAVVRGVGCGRTETGLYHRELHEGTPQEERSHKLPIELS